MLPIYYTNVARRTDRRDFMEQQFSALGLVATRIDAITPDRIPPALLNRYCSPEAPRHSPGELGCNLSHQAAWTAMLESNAPAAVVFEDDGLLSPRLPAFLRLLEQGLPPHVDLIKLETYGHGARLSARQAIQLGEFVMRRLVSSHFCACGYVISRRTAELALGDRTLNDTMVDEYLFTRLGPTIYRRRVYQVSPALSMQLLVDPGRQHDALATSDLALQRSVVLDLKARRTSRWARFRANARSALLDAVHFGGELRALRGKRRPIPFAAD